MEASARKAVGGHYTAGVHAWPASNVSLLERDLGEGGLGAFWGLGRGHDFRAEEKEEEEADPALPALRHIIFEAVQLSARKPRDFPQSMYNELCGTLKAWIVKQRGYSEGGVETLHVNPSANCDGLTLKAVLGWWQDIPGVKVYSSAYSVSFRLSYITSFDTDMTRYGQELNEEVIKPRFIEYI